MKKRKHAPAVLLRALIIYISVLYLLMSAAMPDSVRLYENEPAAINFIGGISREELPDTISVDSRTNTIISRESGEYTAQLKLAGVIPYKDVTLNVSKQLMLVPCGYVAGIRIYSDGLIVVALGNITQPDGLRRSAAREAGIEVGDTVTHLNGKRLRSASHLTQLLEESEGDVKMTYVRNSVPKTVTVRPSVAQADKKRKMGLWVRDSTAGVGTITYYDPKTMRYGALGHAISDLDTGIRFGVLKGSIANCKVVDVTRGERGVPGELRGVFGQNDPDIGTIEQNSDCGIFGSLIAAPETGKRAYPVALKSQVKTGAARILANIDGAEVKEYDIEISRIIHGSVSSTKSMVVRVTDGELIAKTGGIVQGMSGCPIIQNGKIVGAVTHVFVNDPRKGYGIFIEKMLEKSQESA